MTDDTHVTAEMLADRFVRTLGREGRDQLARNLSFTTVSCDGMRMLVEALNANWDPPPPSVAMTHLQNEHLYVVEGRTIKFASVAAIVSLVHELTALLKDLGFRKVSDGETQDSA